MVCFIFIEKFISHPTCRCCLVSISTLNHTLVTSVKRVPVVQHLVFGQFVDKADKFPRLKIFVSFLLKIVKFFQYGNGDANIVSSKLRIFSLVLVNDYRSVTNTFIVLSFFLP